MKFGQTLWQRSVPQWASYNIDYADVKHLIREHTTPGTGKAVSIPGHVEANVEELEDQLFDVFAAQHLRLNQFVKSKVYEINSRLVRVGRQLDKLNQPQTLPAPPRRKPTSLTTRYASLELEVIQTGQEIKDLSRFIAVNRLAFRKLLKKYVKWSGSLALSEKVNGQLLDLPDSFAHTSLRPVLARYTAQLDLLRHMYNRTHALDASQEPTPMQRGSGVDFDTALTWPSNTSGVETATYWIHNDSVVELRILLLQYLSQARFASDQEPAGPLSSAQDITSVLAREDHVGFIVCDDLDRFARAQSGATLAATDASELQAREPAVMVRWTRNGDASVSIPVETGGDSTSSIAHTSASMHRHDLYRFLETSTPFVPLSPTDDQATQPQTTPENMTTIRSWLGDHAEVQPIVSYRCRRARFSGFDGTSSGKLRATLDEEIYMDKVVASDLKNEDYFDPRKRGVKFPHAVLSVRSDTELSELIRVLDESHLTERVRGFSQSVHAVAVCCKPANMPVPYWMSALKKDIRHIPEKTIRLRRSITDLHSSATPRTAGRTPTSISTLSVDVADDVVPSPVRDSPVEYVPITHKKFRSRSAPQTPLEPQEPPRYWNEFDHPESSYGGEGEEYVIYIDPDAPDFPGQRQIMNAIHRIADLFNLRKAKADVPPGQSPTSSTLDSPSRILADDDDEDVTSSEESEETPMLAKRRSGISSRILSGQFNPETYSTFAQLHGGNGTDTAYRHDPHSNPHATVTTTQTLFTTAALCIFASVTLLGLAVLIASTGRRRARGAVDSGIIIGCIASLVFLVAGVSALFRARMHTGDLSISWWLAKAGLRRGMKTNEDDSRSARRSRYSSRTASQRYSGVSGVWAAWDRLGAVESGRGNPYGLGLADGNGEYLGVAPTSMQLQAWEHAHWDSQWRGFAVTVAVAALAVSICAGCGWLMAHVYGYV